MCLWDYVCLKAPTPIMVTYEDMHVCFSKEYSHAMYWRRHLSLNEENWFNATYYFASIDLSMRYHQQYTKTIMKEKQPS